ncbi:hypothetical protein KQX54_009139 [Cotesia glomerata]|uniref:Uncharacterized protein n=1 Tax=Cotesia glomerata TaxID=32391 RepID=A0AAV7J2M9_COTGL|nr:hypothetical protein KQX54_009139 [Cotesia glomerata]
MLKLFATLTILSAGNFDISDAVGPVKTFDGIVTHLIVSPETGLYYVDRLEGSNNITVRRKVNILNASPAYLYYNNPENEPENTFIRKIVVICDWLTVEFRRSEVNLVNDIIKQLDTAAQKLDEIKDPKIILHLTGIIIPKTNDILNVPEIEVARELFLVQYTVCRISFSYINPGPALEYLTNWLDINKNSFQGLSYDFFWFQPSISLKDGPDGKDAAYFTKVDCSNSGSSSSGAIVNPLSQNSFFQVVQMIAQSFGVRDDKELGCKGIMELGIPKLEDMSFEWSNCSKSEFQRVLTDSNYSCYKLSSTISDDPDPSPARVLILSPATQIHYAFYTSDHQLRIERSGNIFQGSEFWNNYRNPKTNRSNTYVQNVLLILDYNLRDLYNDKYELAIPVLQALEKAAVRLNEIESPKILLSVKGIIVPEHSDVFGLPELKQSRFWGTPCRPGLGTLEKLNQWMKDNEKSFRTTPYDLYLFASSRPPCNESNFNKIDNSLTVTYGCNALNYKSGGMFHYGEFYSNLYAAQVVAKTFGVEMDEQAGCGSKNIMFSQDRNLDYGSNFIFRPWSECSQKAFQKMSENHRYRCFKML